MGGGGARGREGGGGEGSQWCAPFVGESRSGVLLNFQANMIPTSTSTSYFNFPRCSAIFPSMFCTLFAKTLLLSLGARLHFPRRFEDCLPEL